MHDLWLGKKKPRADDAILYLWPYMAKCNCICTSSAEHNSQISSDFIGSKILLTFGEAKRFKLDEINKNQSSTMHILNTDSKYHRFGLSI